MCARLFRADTWIRADTWVGPYNRETSIERDKAVKMIGHDHEGVQRCASELPGQGKPPSSTIRPAAFKAALFSSISPNKHSRPWVTSVTKYTPGVR